MVVLKVVNVRKVIIIKNIFCRLLLINICLLSCVEMLSQSTARRDALEGNLSHLKFKDSKMFFYGEQHNYKYTDSVALLLFKKLNSENNTNVYCLEGSKATEYLYYYYFDHKTFHTDDPDDNLYVLENSEIKRKVIPLSNLFTQNNKITLLGYDVELNVFLSIAVINHLLKVNDTNKLFSDICNKIKYSSYKRPELYSLLRMIINYYDSNEELLKQKLNTKDFYYFNKIVEEIPTGIVLDSLYWPKKLEDYYSIREPYILKNLTEIYSNESYNNIFVQIGLDHIITTRDKYNREYYTQFEPFIDSFEAGNYTKIGPVFKEKRKYPNEWFLDSPEKRVELFLKYKNRFTLFDVSNHKKEFNTSFDYIIYCR